MKPEKGMTDQQINIAIAKHLGWQNCCLWSHTGRAVGDPPDKNRRGFIPDYCNDLNAMHEVKNSLTRDQRKAWGAAVITVLSSGGLTYFDLANMTASQEAEVFLRTVGKWEGEE